MVVSKGLPAAPASVSEAGRLRPRFIIVVGSDAVRKGEICTGSRLVGLSRVTADSRLPSASVGQPSSASPLRVTRKPASSRVNEPVAVI